MKKIILLGITSIFFFGSLHATENFQLELDPDQSFRLNLPTYFRQSNVEIEASLNTIRLGDDSFQLNKNVNLSGHIQKLNNFTLILTEENEISRLGYRKFIEATPQLGNPAKASMSFGVSSVRLGDKNLNIKEGEGLIFSLSGFLQLEEDGAQRLAVSPQSVPPFKIKLELDGDNLPIVMKVFLLNLSIGEDEISLEQLRFIGIRFTSLNGVLRKEV